MSHAFKARYAYGLSSDVCATNLSLASSCPLSAQPTLTCLISSWKTML